MMQAFPCTQCGLCCQNVHLAEETQFLNRGDGVCRYYDAESKLCSIYQDRPDICRVDRMYKIHYKNLYSWDEFVDLNVQVCESLNSSLRIPTLKMEAIGKRRSR